MSERKISLLEYVKKERDFFARYRGDHPHFIRNVTIDALLSISLVLGGYTLLTRSSEVAKIDAFRKSGGVTMTASELIKHVRDEKIVAYWLGPISGSKYTIICTDRSNIIITYLTSVESPDNPNQTNLVVETKANSIVSEGPLRSNISLDSDDFMTSTGNSGNFSRTSPREATFIIEPGMVVDTHYSSLQTLKSVKANGEKVKRVW